MKTVVILSFCMLLLCGSAFSQVESIGIYADPDGLSCEASAGLITGILTLYMVHINTAGASGCQFSVDWSTTGLTFINSQSMYYNTIGTVEDDFAVAYGGLCETGPVYIGMIQFFVGAPAPACSYIEVKPASSQSHVIVADCAVNPQLHNVIGTKLVVNNDGTCDCNIPIPVEQTTWGQVKTLYNQ